MAPAAANHTEKSALVTILCLAVALLVAAVKGAYGQHYVFVTTTDYSTGSCSTVDLDGTYTVHPNVASIHSDPLVRYHNGLFYVINRTGADNIQILDPANGFSTVRQFSTGNGSNPQDIAFAAPDKMYVSRFESNTMWIMNPQTGLQTGSIDLSSLADSDGLCEMQYIFLTGGYLFVALQRLDRNNFWGPAGTSYMAVIDVNTDTMVDTDPLSPGVQAIALSNADPFSEIQLNPWTGRLYVAGVGFYGLLDGGVEEIDPQSLTSVTTTFSESAAGGDIMDVEIVSEHIGYCIIQNSSFNTDLVLFDPSTGLKIRTVYSPGAWVLQDVEQAPTGEIFLSDRTPVNPGLRVYDALTGTAILTSPIDVGLPPFDIAFNVDVQTAALGNVPDFARLGLNYPNPFNPSTVLPYSLDRESRVTIQLFDARGKLVRTLVDETKPAGSYETRWDGLDASYTPSPSGVYFARLTTERLQLTRKIILLK
jgi:hypothetical protein